MFVGSLGPWVRLNSAMASPIRKAAAAQATTGQTRDPGVGGDSGAGAQRHEITELLEDGDD